MTAQSLRQLYLVSVLEALTAYAAEGGGIHSATLNHERKLAITFTVDDGDAYTAQVTARFHERFSAQQP
jgi:hypothetical protein